MTPTPSTFSKVLPYKWEAYCRANGTRTEVQMGGVLLASLSSTLRSQEGTTIQMGERTAVRIGGVLQYSLRDQ